MKELRICVFTRNKKVKNCEDFNSLTPSFFYFFIYIVNVKHAYKVGIILFCSAQLIVKAQRSDFFSTSAFSASMGGAVSSVENSAAVFTNGVNLLNQTGNNIIANAEVKFESFEFQSIGLGLFRANVNKNIFGVSVQKLGTAAASFLKFGAVYARQLTVKNSLGINIYYNTWRISGYESNNYLSYAISAKHALSENISLGVQIWNLATYKINASERTSRDARFFAQFKINNVVRSNVEYHFSFENLSGFHVGLAYSPINSLEVRMGVNTQPSFFSLGFAFSLTEKRKIEIGTPSFTPLGFSPAMSYSQGF